MPICSRRAHFEFIGKFTVIITTWLDQKTFRIDKEFAIDLITLKKLPASDWPVVDPPSTFFVNFYSDDEEGNFGGEIYAQLKEDEVDCIGIIDWKDYNNQTFRVNVWTEK